MNPVRTERNPLKFGVDHRRRIYLRLLHRADVPLNRRQATNPWKNDKPRQCDDADTRGQPQRTVKAGMDHGSTTFLNSQPNVRLAIASESARFRHWPST